MAEIGLPTPLLLAVSLDAKLSLRGEEEMTR
jgi:hypothetical protein